MDTDLEITPEQARERIAASSARRLGSAPDRKMYALGTIALGLAVGVYFATENLVHGVAYLVSSMAFVAVLVAAEIWVQGATRTVPRRARLWSRIGFGASFALGFVAVGPWLNLQERTDLDPWLVALAASLVITAPSLVAAAAISRERR